MKSLPVVVLVALTGCRQLLGLEDPALLTSDASTRDDAVTDAPAIDAPPLDAAPLGAWGTPVRVFAAAASDDDPSLTDDLLELYFERGGVIYASTRASRAAAWSAPAVVGALDDPTGTEGTPEIARDGLTIVFASNRSPSFGSFDVWQATRTSRATPWSAPTRVPSLSSALDDVFGGISDDGLVAVLARRPAAGGASSLHRSVRSSTAIGWPAPTPIAALNVGPSDKSPNIVGPQQTLYFDSDRDGDDDIYVAELVNADYESAVLAPGLALASIEEDAWVSSDQRVMVFASSREGGSQLFWAER